MKALIKQTLASRFNLDNFISFSKNFFNEIEIDPQEINAAKGFEEYIKKFVFLGEFSDAEKKNIDVLAVELSDDSKVERARSFQRNLIARYLKDNFKDAGLVAFYSTDSPDWRLSFVKMEYKFTDKGAKVEVGTPPKRYSFLVGQTEPSHTAQKQLLPILEDHKHNPLVSQIEEAFSVEKVTKDFYISILRCFTKLVGGEALVGSHRENYRGILKLPSTVDHKKKQEFATRLLGRIIFCWFLKKKKSVQGNFIIPEDLISRESLGKCPNYYHIVLEPLFFQQLNTPLNLREDKYKNSDIPFLNGGLFQPHVDDFYQVNIVTGLSLHNNTLIIPDDWLKELFGILEIYNFTIDENISIDIDLSIDPEILGRIFENLLAEINPETGETARKSTGSYYTPRSIVEFMVDETLKHYLENTTGVDLERLSNFLSYDGIVPKLANKEEVAIIEALDRLKIIDPACGSGAFPMGILQKAVLILQKVDPQCKLWLEKQISRIEDGNLRQVLEEKLKNENLDYIRKLGIVQNTVHGIDIQPMAVEIAKLRFFLSLIVDADVDDSKENRGIHPLPNLEFKFVCANSLIEPRESAQAGSFHDRFFYEFEKLTKSYFSISNPKEKGNLRKEIEGLINRELGASFSQVISLAKASITDNPVSKQVKQKHVKQIGILSYEAGLWESYLNIFKDEPVGFFNAKYFFPEVKEGFDVVIANPPYVKEYVNRVAFDGLRESPYYQGKMDIWYLFACKGIDLLKKDSGILTFIAQNNWVTSYGASKMRNKVIKDAQILHLIDFGDFKIFESADIQTMIMVFKANAGIDVYSFDLRRLRGKNINFHDTLDLLHYIQNQKCEYLTPTIRRNEYVDKSLTFSGSAIGGLLNKIAQKRDFEFNGKKEVAQGIVYPQDYVNKASRLKLGNKFSVGDGIFVLNEKEKNKIQFTKKELELLKPLYTTKELLKWYGNRVNTGWVIYTDSRFKNHKNIESYPSIKAHLDQYKGVITSDNKPYGLHRSREEYFFKGEKIIAVRKCSEPTFTYTDFDCYVSATFYVIKSERIGLKYLTALFNSKLIAFWLRHRGKMQGNNYQIDKEPLLSIPIKAGSTIEQKSLTEVVDKIIITMQDAKYQRNDSKQAKVKEYERQIDQMVYKLYDLTEDEIKIIENDNGYNF